MIAYMEDATFKMRRDECITRVIDAMGSFGPAYEPTLDEIEFTRDALTYLLNTGVSPTERFDAIAAGAFKECYELTSRLVIKFVNDRNPTASEKALSDLAEQNGVADVFLPIRVIGMPRDLPAEIVEENNSYWYGDQQTWDSAASTWVENEDYVGPVLTHIIIQPRISEVALKVDGTQISWNSDEYYQDPVVDFNTGEVMPFDLIDEIGIGNRAWLEALWMRVENLEDVARFIKDNDINDTHDNNLGFIYRPDGAFPVVIDCFSSPDSE